MADVEHEEWLKDQKEREQNELIRKSKLPHGAGAGGENKSGPTEGSEEDEDEEDEVVTNETD